MISYSRVLVIYNPNAMRGKIDEFLPKIKERLFLRFSVVDSVTSATSAGAEELAYKNAGKYDIIISCGGDGTLHQIVNGVLKSEHRPLIGILPYGTCNDVATTLKLPKNLDKALEAILRLHTTKYDIAFDGENYMVYSLAGGYLTSTSYKTTSSLKKKFGRKAYFLHALKCLFKFKSIPATVVADGERIHDKFIYMMLINGENAGGFKLNKGEDLHNKKIKLVLIKKRGFLSGIFAFFKLFMFGINSIRRNKNCIVKDVSKVEIENPSNTPFTFDGEKALFLKKKYVVNSCLTIIKN